MFSSTIEIMPRPPCSWMPRPPCFFCVSSVSWSLLVSWVYCLIMLHWKNGRAKLSKTIPLKFVLKSSMPAIDAAPFRMNEGPLWPSKRQTLSEIVSIKSGDARKSFQNSHWGAHKRKAIIVYLRFRLRRQQQLPVTSPCTGLELPSAALMPLLALQKAIEVGV